MDVGTQEPGFVGHNRPQLTQHVAINPRTEPAIFFGRYRQREAGLGIIQPTLLADRVMISVELEARGPTDLFEDGRHLRRPDVLPGSFAIFDLRATWAADVRDPFDNLNMFLPLETFAQAADEQAGSFRGFNYAVEVNQPDQTMHHLALAMLPVLERRREVSALFIDHLFGAAREHILQTYAIFSQPLRGQVQVLSVRQKQTVLAFLEAHLDADPSVGDLARVSNMSDTSFARAFKRTLGAPPHQWLMRRRVEKAKRMLLDRNERLVDIAIACGFADQSHLTRVFVRHVGMTPRRWRQDITS